jgi:hypothetical protein
MGLISNGKKLQRFYGSAKKFAKSAEIKTKKAKELADKLNSVVQEAEDARKMFFEQLGEARRILARLHDQTLFNLSANSFAFFVLISADLANFFALP